ncbi:uncharacterized protein LOC128491384 [Spea bombifrons]|uniref:uncharacterized protein LOC128491384 n=1 Tax=Spea bombifrons TaxID=233779 RepID=UPI00234960B9|nr:uncharacterized protein LOC128491384 [Spea bombifrons]
MAQPLLRRRSALILVLIIWKLQLHAVRSDVKVWSTTNTEDHLGPLEPNHMASDKARFSCPVGLRRKAGTSSLALCKKTTFKCELRDPSSQVLTTMELPKVDSSPAPMSDLSSPASLPTMSTEKGRLTTRSFTAKKTETITHTSDGVTRLAKPPDRSTTTTPNKSDNRHDIVTKDRSVERTTGENTATDGTVKWNNTEDDTATTQAPESTVKLTGGKE